MVMLTFLDNAILCVGDQGAVDFDVFDPREQAPFYTFDERPKRNVMVPSRREGSHSFFAPGVTPPNFHFATSNCRSVCATGGVVVHKPPVQTSARAAASFRRWTRRLSSLPAGWP